MAGGERATGLRSGTPQGELTRIEEDRERRTAQTRRRILEAMLVACGEKGYRRVAVQDVIDGYGGNRVQFYRHFSGKAGCFEAAYEDGIERLSERLLDTAAEEQGWRPGLRAGLAELAAAVEESPLLARGLLIEVQLAGAPAMNRRAEAMRRFERALDRARAEAGDGPSPPPLTAPLMVGAIESALNRALMTGQPQAFRSAVPELTQMIVSAYLGEEAAASSATA